MILLACLAALANPDDALICAFHNPDLDPVVIGDTGTPKTHADPDQCYLVLPLILDGLLVKCEEGKK